MLATTPEGWKAFVRANGIFDFAATSMEHTDFPRSAYDNINLVQLYDLWVNKDSTSTAASPMSTSATTF